MTLRKYIVTLRPHAAHGLGKQDVWAIDLVEAEKQAKRRWGAHAVDRVVAAEPGKPRPDFDPKVDYPERYNTGI
jgi:hypothetical protein